MVTASVMKSGNSAVVALPKRFRTENDIAIGDRVVLEYSSEGTLIVRPLPKEASHKQELLAELLALAEAAEPVPWESDAAEAARDLLEERYV